MNDCHVELSGCPQMLDHAARLFSFPWCSIQNTALGCSLTSEDFTQLSDAEQVAQKARALVQFVNSVIMLTAGNAPPLEPTAVIWADERGNHGRYPITGKVSVLRRQPASEEDDDLLMLPFQAPQLIQKLHDRAATEDTIRWILQFWASPGLGYHQLWVVWDLIRQHIVDTHGVDKEFVRSFIVDDTQWASDEEIRRFSCTANSLKVAGLDSRHGTFPDPPDECLTSWVKMDGVEAYRLIERILKSMLLDDVNDSELGS